MSQSEIHIKIDDPIWMDAFKSKFLGFCVERQGHEMRIPMWKVIQILKAEADYVWDEYIFENKKADCVKAKPLRVTKQSAKKKAICRDHC